MFAHNSNSETYETNHAGDSPDVIACFDTDYTVDYARGPVPLSHIHSLRVCDDVSVWATGHNQTLRRRAEIPGTAELNELNDRPRDKWIPRAERMRMLRRLYPGSDTRFVVDDCNLELLEPTWSYYPPGVYARDALHIDDPDVMEPRFEYTRPGGL